MVSGKEGVVVAREKPCEAGEDGRIDFHLWLIAWELRFLTKRRFPEHCKRIKQEGRLGQTSILS